MASHANVNKGALILKGLFNLTNVTAVSAGYYAFRGSEDSLTRMLKFIALIENWPKKELNAAIKEITPTKYKKEFEVHGEMDSYTQFMKNIEETLFIKKSDFKKIFNFPEF